MQFWKRLIPAGLAAALLFSLPGCSGGGTPASPAAGSDAPSGEPVRIATKPMTEQYILGEMLGLLIEQAGYPVEITKGVGGGTNNIHPAMESGEFDLYPEYTSSGWVLVLDHQAEGVDDEAMFTQLQQEYEEQFGMTWVGMYGFNNTFTIAVRGDVAQEYGLETTSDLAAVAGELTFGGNPDYLERADGFPLLERGESCGLYLEETGPVTLSLSGEGGEELASCSAQFRGGRLVLTYTREGRVTVQMEAPREETAPAGAAAEQIDKGAGPW